MQTLPQTLRIGVIRGGPSSEYDISLQTGKSVLEHLSETHRPIDIYISRDGKWHIKGIERPPERIFGHVDVIFNALHGKYGEDGVVQEILNRHGVKYTGSDRYPSAVAMNKWLTKEKAKSFGIKTPIAHLVKKDDDLKTKTREILTSIPYPIIVKPTSGGSSIGLHVANSHQELLEAISYILGKGDSVLVEEMIKGKEASCGVIENFRNREIYSLPPVEIIPPKGKIFDYESKYNGKSTEICPGNFSNHEKAEIERISTLIHKILELSHYSRSDFIVSPKRGVYFLEVNTLPGLTKESLLPKSLEAIGSNMKEFIHHTIGLALNK